MKYYTVENPKKSIFKIFAIYFACMAIFCCIRILASLGFIPDGKWGDVLYSIIIQVGVLFLLPMGLYCLFMKSKPKEVFKKAHFYKINFKIVLISLGLGIICFFINVAVSSLFNGILTFTGFKSSGGSSSVNYSTLNFFIDLFIVAVLPAFCEEFLHRGILLQGIKHAGFKKAIVISSLLFALLHFNIQQTSYAFVIGLIMGFVSVVSKNIYPAMIIHFTNNAISTYLEYASANDWWLGDIIEKLQTFLVTYNAVWVFIISAIIMIIIVGLLILFIWLLYKQAIINKVKRAIDNVYDSKDFNNQFHLQINGVEAIKDLLEKNTLLNLDYKQLDNPIDMVLPKEKSRYKSTLKDKIFMWGAITLGGLITLFTYIWGLF